MKFFPRLYKLQAEIRDLKQVIEDQDDALVNWIQSADIAKHEASNMEILRSESGMCQAALDCAKDIEDLFVQSHFGGRGQRLAKIQIRIRDEMQKMLIGKKVWVSSTHNSTEPID